MITIALAQFEVSPGRPDLNFQKMISLISRAKSEHCDMVVFPEMAIPGYLLGDTWEQTAFLKDCEDYGLQITALSADIAILFGNVAIDWNKKGNDGRVRKYNAFFIASQGQLHGGDNFLYPFRIKTLQPNYREFEDDRHFFSLRKLASEQLTTTAALLQPVQLTIKNRLLNLGCFLCEDGWSEDYDLDPLATLHQKSPVDLFINISSSPFTLGKNHKRHRVFAAQAKRAGVPLLYVNNTGIQNNGKTLFTFDGCSTAYNQDGETILHCSSFKEAFVTVNLEELQRSGTEKIFHVPEDRNIDNIYAGLNYGISRFLQTIGMSKVVVGVSGGIDSAVAAALYQQIVGPENLLLVNMPSEFNSRTTISLASQLAKNLSCRYEQISIQQSLSHTVQQLESASLPLSSFMKENIQARDRSSRILAAAASAWGGGFSCNANKTELTVGYCTLYGDESGFLAALADLWKHQVYELGCYINTTIFNSPVIPQEIFNIVPSAELSAEQDVDAGKGDPLIYPYHDYLFRSFVERWQRATPEDILLWYSEGVLEENIGCEAGLINRIFPDCNSFIADLERWWKLYVGMGVAKRIQAPPVLAVSRRVFGFDHREAQNQPYFTQNYYRVKSQLLR